MGVADGHLIGRSKMACTQLNLTVGQIKTWWWLSWDRKCMYFVGSKLNHVLNLQIYNANVCKGEREGGRKDAT